MESENIQEEIAVENTKTAEVSSASVKPSWIKMKPQEFEKLVVELAREGKTPAMIGLILRDKHGVPRAKVFGKKISNILEENEIKFKTEKEIINEKVGNLKKHSAVNKRDHPASRALTKKLWVAHALESY